MFGEKLKELREYLRLSQDKLAEKLNTHQHTISNYEMGVRFPDVRFIQKLSETTNVNISWLFGQSEHMFQGFQSDDIKIQELLHWMKQVPVLQYRVLCLFEEMKVKEDKFFKPNNSSQKKGVLNEKISIKEKSDN